MLDNWYINNGFLAAITVALILAVGCPSSPETNTTTAQALSKSSKAEFLVKNMTCGSCDRAIKTTLEKMEGVELVQADFKRGYASASFNPGKVTAEELVAAINSLGFESRIRLSDDADIAPSPHGVPETKQTEEPKQGE